MKAGKLVIRPKSSPNLNSCSIIDLPLRDFSILTLLLLAAATKLSFSSSRQANFTGYWQQSSLESTYIQNQHTFRAENFTVNSYSPYRHSIGKSFVCSFPQVKIYSLKLNHLLDFTLHSKPNACKIGTFIRFQIQMRVQIKNKAFAYRFYRPFTQQCIIKQ